MATESTEATENTSSKYQSRLAALAFRQKFLRDLRALRGRRTWLSYRSVPRYKLTIEYAGTKYSGWQKQKNARTVQGELESAIGAATREKTFECMGSGRTDAGVHALRQVAHLELRKPLPAETVRRGINDNLPADIHVLAVDSVPHRFHARHDAIARSYLYQVSRRRSAFAKPFVWWVREPLDVDRMRQAALQFTGMHDFQAFSDDDPEEKSTDVLVEDIAVAEAGDLILFRVGGSHFIWKMVRRMVGVLVAIGKGELAPEDLGALLQGPNRPTAPGAVEPARLTAPASGLFLERVFYQGDPRQWPLLPAVPVGLPRG
jgi:tRNA pseudouridine38-40 synthase